MRLLSYTFMPTQLPIGIVLAELTFAECEYLAAGRRLLVIVLFSSPDNQDMGALEKRFKNRIHTFFSTRRDCDCSKHFQRPFIAPYNWYFFISCTNALSHCQNIVASQPYEGHKGCIYANVFSAHQLPSLICWVILDSGTSLSSILGFVPP